MARRAAERLGALQREAERLASEERTLLVGDSIVDFDTARIAGVACCLVSWGFGY